MIWVNVLKKEMTCLEYLDSKGLIEQIIDDNDIVLLYFGSKSCGVCRDIKPKIEKILNRYSKIKGIYVDVEKSHNIAISYNIFTIPGILLFVEGKETIREARHISMQDIDSKIYRYYSLLFE